MFSSKKSQRKQKQITWRIHTCKCSKTKAYPFLECFQTIIICCSTNMNIRFNDFKSQICIRSFENDNNCVLRVLRKLIVVVREFPFLTLEKVCVCRTKFLKLSSKLKTVFWSTLIWFTTLSLNRTLIYHKSYCI